MGKTRLREKNQIAVTGQSFLTLIFPSNQSKKIDKLNCFQEKRNLSASQKKPSF